MEHPGKFREPISQRRDMGSRWDCDIWLGYEVWTPGVPLKGPVMWEVIQPP
jgi:hypothetical protein